ncbi:hypothetical protein EJ02DRAFT_436666 [Clathrospora elynae]|uniref:Uncharacterized protein n=1 Tax=Clathrospora elynae TaxID=706981 RepID=A0A6A5SPA9_9PLEO|nr:hypothetical protein EJ02DRAFT_436666 [Clathrospora elynae]
MALKPIIMELRQSLLCCSKRIPPDIRSIEISDALPRLTSAQRKYIGEKASTDAIHLLSLQPYPPISPTSSSTPNPFQSTRLVAFTAISSSSVVSSEEPSMALLNAASKDFPEILPIPPRRTHKESSPLSMRMKSMWYSARRYNSNSNGEDEGLYEKLSDVSHDAQDEKKEKNTTTGKNVNELFMTLSLEFDWEDKKEWSNSPRTLSLTTEGFEM